VTDLRALLIPIGLDLYAVPMESVREVLAAPRLCSLPTGPSAVLGLFNLRGEIVPLFDSAALIGLGRLTVWPFAAVVRTSRGPAGLGTSGLPESILLGEAIGPSESPGTSGLYAVDKRLATLIDVDALLAPARTGGHVLVGSASEQP
jgi:purine-binding chemotaxis protein CheW